jgi:hypothetical protein
VEISIEARARASKLVVFCGTTFVRKHEINKAGYNPKPRIKLRYTLQTANSNILHFDDEFLLHFRYFTAAMCAQYRSSIG